MTTPLDPPIADCEAPQPVQPYQPYMDAQPPREARLSDANGMPLTEREVEALEKDEVADRAATPEPENFRIAFPDNLPTPPFLHVEGVPNFRDLGGYKCKPPTSSSSEGKTHVLRKNVLYRCAHPTHLTQKGATYLTGTLNVHDLYDLRSAPEIARLADTVASSGTKIYPLADPETGSLDSVPSLTRHFVPVYQSEDYGPVALARKLAWYTAEQSLNTTHDFPYSEGFVRAYRDIATHGAPAYKTMFRHLLDRPDDPLVFHCTAGKDRTGVFGALIMTLVGVDEETICWEYALTEPGLGGWRKEFIERISKTGLGGGGSKPTVQSTDQNKQEVVTGQPEPGKPAITRKEAARICGARAGNMRAFIRTVLEGEFGGVQKYLTEKCGLNEEEVGRLRESLVQEVDVKDVLGQVEIPGWTAEGGVVD